MRILLILVLVLAGQAGAYELGDTVADFTLTDLTGHAASLSDHQGQVVVRKNISV